MRSRNGLTIIELLVVIGIITILIAMLLPAIQQAREAAYKVQTASKLRDLVYAVQHYSINYGDKLPQLIGVNPSVSMSIALLPYMERESVYKDFLEGTPSGGASYVIRNYLNSIDPSFVTNADGNGVASYVANAQIYAPITKIGSGIRDGTSYTISFSEHYSTIYLQSSDTLTQFYWRERFPRTNVYPTYTRKFHTHRTTFADNGPVVRYWYTPSPPETASLPAYIDAYPLVTPTGTSSSIPGLTFQIRPTPEQADPRIPQTPHTALPVAMLDGSVRWLQGGMSESAFWSAVSPNGGEASSFFFE